ncbi:MAG: UDP-N-acetylmuramoylalanine--D-glutamate ligase [Acidobacteriota bacterium]|jgi:UDP-N-acetylmuramoylalanine--D-glutamate ligase|nr:UDP-N-acetylmuramoylalanine--D-glutamate ligase [Acidobacteriota bacterium]
MNGPWTPSGRFERVLVYGLGLSGRAAARLLLAHGATVLAVDDKAVDAGELAGKVELVRELPPGIDLVVVSPGVPLDKPILEEARRRGVPIIAEVELAFPFLNGPVVAITGSNGKSTTTAMAGAMVRAAGLPVEVCGNIGEPLADKVDGPPGRVFVVELSSFQIEGIVTLRPKAAALLNLAEDHLDRYGSMAAYAAAKRRLFRDMDEGDVAVLNADDPETLRTPTRARRRLFSRLSRVEDGCFATADGRVIEVSPGEEEIELFHAADVPLAGVQNLENAMAAALLARAVGVQPAAIAAALRGFTGLPHRLEKVGERDGVTFYDDSKGTNPAATLKSIEGFADGTVHLILGGRNKGADLSVLEPLVRRKARRAYLIGESAPDFEQALGATVPHETPGTMDRAVASAARQAQPGEVVVLSPACASFDQFRNFMHRGQVFQGLVQDLLGGPPHGEEARL